MNSFSLMARYPPNKRHCCRWMAVLLLILVSTDWLGGIHSFQVLRRLKGRSTLAVAPKPIFYPAICMSSSSNEDEEDPTLTALRKKREQILSKKTKKEDDSDSNPPSQAVNKARIASLLTANESSTPTVVPDSSSSAATTPTKKKLKNVGSSGQQPPPKSATRQPQTSSSSASASAKTHDYLKQTKFSLPSDENELHIPNRIGFGTQSWGDISRGFTSERKMTKRMAKEGKLFNAGDLISAYQILLSGGITFIDTSEAYGTSNKREELSSAEKIIAMCNEQQSSSSFGGTPILASKFEPTHNLLRRFTGLASSSVVRAIRSSCERLETNCVDLYQLDVMQPTLFVGGKASFASGLAKAVDLGLCNHVGVCNMNARQMKSMHRKLDKVGIPLASNQFEFSLVNRRALFNGQIEACKDLGVIPLAHTPLARGLATGKYTALNPTGGKLGEAKFDFQTLDPLSPIHEAQEKVSGMVRARLLKAFNEDKQMRSRNYKMKNVEGEFNQQITTTQVAINYVVAKGAVPIPGINNAKEAEELLGCIGWGLTEDEVRILDEACDKAERFRPSTPKKPNFFFGARKKRVNLGF